MGHPDWKLVNVMPNVYDRAHTGHDLVKVEDKDSLFNSIIIRLMTVYKEIEHTVYRDYGNYAWAYLSTNITPENIEGVKDYTADALKSITRVKSLELIDAEEGLGPHTITCNFTVRSADYHLIEGVDFYG